MIVSNFCSFIYFLSTFVLTHVLGDMKNLKCCGVLGGGGGGGGGGLFFYSEETDTHFYTTCCSRVE